MRVFPLKKRCQSDCPAVTLTSLFYGTTWPTSPYKTLVDSHMYLQDCSLFADVHARDGMMLNVKRTYDLFIFSYGWLFGPGQVQSLRLWMCWS